MRIVAGVCLAALALAACNKTADKGAAASAEGGAPAAAAAATPRADLDAAPHLKAGLWEITNAGMGPAGKARTCVSDESQEQSAIIGQGMDRQNCSRSDWARIPGGVAFDFVCESRGGTVTSKGSVTGDFSSAYHLEAEAGMTKDGVTQTGKQRIDARYVGACPAGMKPGDTQITVDGRTITVPARVPG